MAHRGIAKRDHVRAAYDRHAREMNQSGHRFNPTYLSSKALCDWAPLYDIDLSESRILNIGCSEPIDELHFAERVKTWVATDINHKIIEAGRRLFLSLTHPELSRRVHFAVMDAGRLAFPSGIFDLVVSYSSIEHIPDEGHRQLAYEEVRRVLKARGLAVITVPNRYSSFRFAHRRNTRGKIPDYGYAYLYSVRELRRCLRKAGLEPVKFTADLLGAISLLSYCPNWLSYLFRPIGYFSDRIGYVCHAR